MYVRNCVEQFLLQIILIHLQLQFEIFLALKCKLALARLNFQWTFVNEVVMLRAKRAREKNVFFQLKLYFNTNLQFQMEITLSFSKEHF